MKKIAFITFVLVLACSFSYCEKDDICAEGTPTTPSMVVEFFNIDNPSVNVSISNIRYFVEGVDDTISIPGLSSAIRVPLRVDATSTKWGFIYTTVPTGSTTPILNTDFIEFNYTTQQTYISRACGYKSTFFLDDVAPFELFDDGNMWLGEVEVEKYNIEDENETHISIYL